MQRVRLKDPTGVFADEESGLRIKLKEVVDAPEPWGRRTREWLNAGGLVLVPSPDEDKPLPPPAPEEGTGEVSSSFSSPDAPPIEDVVIENPEPKKKPTKKSIFKRSK